MSQFFQFASFPLFLSMMVSGHAKSFGPLAEREALGVVLFHSYELADVYGSGWAAISPDYSEEVHC